MHNPKEEIIILDNHNGLPYTCTPENLDLWPSVKATKLMIEAAVEIVNLGFKGVRIQAGNLDEYTGATKTIYNFMYAEALPEGVVFTTAMQLTAKGIEVPVDIVIKTIERMYLENNLELPYDKVEGA